MKRLVFVALAVLSVLGVEQSVELHVAAKDVAAVSTRDAAPVQSMCGTCGFALASAQEAPVGTCSRCGRTIYGAWTNRNARLEVRDYRSGAVRWTGCMDCLYDVLRRNQ